MRVVMWGGEEEEEETAHQVKQVTRPRMKKKKERGAESSEKKGREDLPEQKKKKRVPVMLEKKGLPSHRFPAESGTHHPGDIHGLFSSLSFLSFFLPSLQHLLLLRLFVSLYLFFSFHSFSVGPQATVKKSPEQHPIRHTRTHTTNARTQIQEMSEKTDDAPLKMAHIK